MAKKTKFFRVAVEGATVDGRTIDAKWLTEMAANYNAVTYPARVNMEHYRSAWPMTGDDNGSAFGSYGDVISLKTETIDLEIGGKTEKRLALYAEIEAHEPMLALIDKKQKLYTSIEINPSFSSSGQAYLMGIAMTDSPASLGTEMLQFSASQGDKSPLAHRKQQPGNYFSAAEEVQIEFADETPADNGGGLVAFMRSVFEPFINSGGQNGNKTDPQPAPVTLTANEDRPANEMAIGLLLGQFAAASDKQFAATNAAITVLSAKVDALTNVNANNPAVHFTPRPLGLTTETPVKTDF